MLLFVTTVESYKSYKFFQLDILSFKWNKGYVEVYATKSN